MNLYKSFFKRAIDVLASGGALIVLALPLGIITLWLHFANKGVGAFFHQERPGKDGKIFRVHKFKSMTDERDAQGNLYLSQRLEKIIAASFLSPPATSNPTSVTASSTSKQYKSE